MRSKNLITGVRRKNSYSYDAKNEEGVFKTAQGKYIVKVTKSNKAVTIGNPLDSKKEAIALYNQFKAS